MGEGKDGIMKLVHVRTSSSFFSVRTGARIVAVCLALLSAVIWVVPTSVAATGTSANLKQIERQLNEVRADRKQLASEATRLSGQLAILEGRSDEQRAAYDEALAQKEAALEVLKSNEQAAAAAKADYEDKRAQYNARIAAMYDVRHRSVFEILFSAKNLRGVFSTWRFMKLVADADEQMLDRLAEASALADEMHESAASQYDELIRLVEEADAAMRTIERETALTRAELDGVKQKLTTYRQKEKQLEQERTRAEAAARPAVSPSAGAPKSGPLWVGTGRFIWPLPYNHYVTSVYGWRAKYGRFHYGTDVAAPMGSPIVAMDDGVVIWADWPGNAYHWAYGKMIVVNHPDGYQTRYGHLSAFNSYPGKKVKKGDVIGYTGNTGRSSGPHLHFETRLNGKVHDPLVYFKRVR